MAFDLKSITSGREVKPPTILLYGVRGIGKSTWASEAESPIFLPTEEGLNYIDCSKFPLAQSVDDCMEAIATLYTQDHPYKTFVIDTIDWFEKLVHNEVRKLHGEAIFTDYGRGYMFSVPFFSRLLEGLTALRNHKNMVIILLGHSAIKRFDSPETTGYDRFVPDIHEKVMGPVEEWADAVFFANYKVFVSKEDSGFGKQKGKAVGKGDRTVYTVERPAFHAKNRFKLPPEIPFHYSTFMQAFSAGLALTDKRDVVTIPEEAEPAAAPEVEEKGPRKKK